MEGDERLADAERELADARDEGGLRLARALIRRARVLHRLDRDQDAFADLNEVASRFGAVDDLGLREQLAWSMWLRMDWSAPSDAQTLEASRAIFALCNDAPSTWLEGLGARALARQADAHRGLGDLRAAIATRRWLVSEFGDVRPRGDPDLVFDQWHLLAQDFWEDDQMDACATALADLFQALTDADVASPQQRAAEALRLQVLALWNVPSRPEAMALCDQLQTRFAEAEEPGARLAAVDALVSLIKRLLFDTDVRTALRLAREVRARFDVEVDDDTLLPLGEELETVADWMAQPVRPVWVSAFTAAAVRVPPAHGLPSRRRLRLVAAEIAKLACATSINDVLLARFAGAAETRRRGLEVRARLRRGVIAARGGRFTACVEEIEAYQSDGAEAVAAALSDVARYSRGGYPLVIWMAAVMGATVSLGSGADADHIRETIAEIVEKAGRFMPFAQRQLRAMDARSD